MTASLRRRATILLELAVGQSSDRVHGRWHAGRRDLGRRHDDGYSPIAA